MTEQEIKSFIAEKVPEGHSLSKIQDMLKSQGVNITFMELRLLASELEEGLWKKEDEKKDEERAKSDRAAAMGRGGALGAPGASAGAPAGNGMGEGIPPEEEAFPPANAQEELPEDDLAGEEASPLPDGPGEPAGEENAPQGKTVVELSPIARPGAIASGTVKFGSGVTADWVLDRTGRIGLDNPTGSPTQRDVQEFQIELQKLFAR